MKRPGAPQRRTPLGRGTPPRRGTRKPARGAPGPRNEFTPKTRGLILTRDNWQCVACGKPVGGACTWWSIQHRKARGVGGGNEASNGIVLCGSATSPGCHRRCEDRNQDMHARGYWLDSSEDPATKPVCIAGEVGDRWVLLTDNGIYIDTDPPQEWTPAA